MDGWGRIEGAVSKVVFYRKGHKESAKDAKHKHIYSSLKYIPPRRKLYWGFKNRKENGGNTLFTAKDASILEQGNMLALMNLHEKHSYILDKFPVYQVDCNLTLMDCKKRMNNMLANKNH